MGKSIMQEDRTICYFCGRNGSRDPLEEHHVFGGANRKLSEKRRIKGVPVRKPLPPQWGRGGT